MTNIEQKLIEYKEWLVKEKDESSKRVMSLSNGKTWMRNAEESKLQMFSNALDEFLNNPMIPDSLKFK